ncbi:uncharacterized protein V6R79_009881 [Siganus canaliculatus]
MLQEPLSSLIRRTRTQSQDQDSGRAAPSVNGDGKLQRFGGNRSMAFDSCPGRRRRGSGSLVGAGSRAGSEVKQRKKASDENIQLRSLESESSRASHGRDPPETGTVRVYSDGFGVFPLQGITAKERRQENRTMKTSCFRTRSGDRKWKTGSGRQEVAGQRFLSLASRPVAA